ncbi:MAG: hypothetical protein WC934_13020 [Acidithiobacillus sp.]|jgi:hypothetical protein|uniref:hypothetical protein n=1 Tax=Acidithiobacillus sp. TaxID=1872118 RepID=UPI00355CCDF0
MNTIFYAHQYYDNKLFHNIFSHQKSTQMCGDDPIFKIEFEVGDTDEYTYWGWLEDGEVCMIFPHKILFEICFAYGYKVEEERGRGKAIKLKVINSEIFNA